MTKFWPSPRKLSAYVTALKQSTKASKKTLSQKYHQHWSASYTHSRSPSIGAENVAVPQPFSSVFDLNNSWSCLSLLLSHSFPNFCSHESETPVQMRILGAYQSYSLPKAINDNKSNNIGDWMCPMKDQCLCLLIDETGYSRLRTTYMCFCFKGHRFFEDSIKHLKSLFCLFNKWNFFCFL